MEELYAFEWALQQLRQGKKVSRRDWNGKSMYIVLQKGYPDGIPINENTSAATGMERGRVCKFLPYLMLKTTDFDPSFVPWIASQTDILAFDWGYAD